MADGKPLNPILVDGVDEGPGLSAGVGDARKIDDEALSHLIAREVAIGQAETADLVLHDGLSLRSVVSDSSIFHEDGPVLLPCESQPSHIDYIFISRDAVVLGQRGETQPLCSQK